MQYSQKRDDFQNHILVFKNAFFKRVFETRCVRISRALNKFIFTSPTFLQRYVVKVVTYKIRKKLTLTKFLIFFTESKPPPHYS